MAKELTAREGPPKLLGSRGRSAQFKAGQAASGGVTRADSPGSYVPVNSIKLRITSSRGAAGPMQLLFSEAYDEPGRELHVILCRIQKVSCKVVGLDADCSSLVYFEIRAAAGGQSEFERRG